MKKLLSLLTILMLSFLIPANVYGQSASFYLAPSRGTFFVGSTFNVSIYLDTKGNKINTLELDLKFPQDILQVTIPTAGESFISEWITPPSYSNIGGKISFKGDISEGIATSAGLVSIVTFRAKSPGTAKIEFSDSSKILLAGEKDKPIFTFNVGGVYEILIPPPEGPKISSPTHPDPEIWYSDPNPQFYWEKEEGVIDFSYSFSRNPQENPDNVSEGSETFKSYEGVSDGIWYFHLRAKKDGFWGKTTHTAVRIDTSPPQKFKTKAETYSGFIYFETGDVYSGIDHYEVSVVNLSEVPTPAPFFIEATSPYKIPGEKVGRYRAIVRAYDRAGNFETAEIEFQKLSPLISFVENKGIEIKGIFISWPTLFLGMFLLLVILGFLFFHLLKPRTGFRKGIKEIKEALEEIKKIEKREGEIKETKRKFEEEKEKLEEKLKT